MQYLVVILGLCTVAITWEILLEPYHGLAEEIARVASLEYQREFGFEIGPIRMWPDREAGMGIARVAPGGRFDRADVRSGDFVFTRHGSTFGELFWALRSAEAGEMACLDLVNIADRLLSRIVFSLDELQLTLDTPAIARLVVARVDVDARGCAARVSLRDLASTEALAPLVVERLQRAVFVPAKPEAQFIGGAMDISLFVDVR